MDESYNNMPTSYLLGSVPAVVSDEKNATNDQTPTGNMQIFPPNHGSNSRGYQTLESSNESFEQQSDNSWNGVFNISSYTQFFNVDTDDVLNRMMSSLSPTSGDFFSKIDANPDLYGFLWIVTTLVFVLASLGNCATYLSRKRADGSTTWNFDVSYVNFAVSAVYGYSIVVPMAFYFILRYLGSNADLVKFWCLWGYSLFIFIPSTFILLIPFEFLRWFVILLAGAASSSFVALNLRSYVEGVDLSIVLMASFVLQMALAVFMKVWFFP